MSGRYRSRTLSSICSEARNLAEQGVRELVLISQDSTIYGWDLGLKEGLATLVRELAKTEGIEWIRVLYCYPNSLRKSFLDAMATQEKICSYVDMPLQHASGPMLARMKRGGNADQYRRMIDKIRNKIPHVGIRTTFIAGFPGETDTDFQILMDFIREVEFDRMGVFLYSDEEGTDGFLQEPKVTHKVILERKKELMQLQAGISKKRNRALIGKQMKALVDGSDSRSVLARLYHQAPEVDGVLRIQAENALPGDFLDVLISGAGEYDLRARPVEYDHSR